MAASNYNPLADKFIKVLQWTYSIQFPENYAEKIIIAITDDTISAEPTVQKFLSNFSAVHDDIFYGKTNLTPAKVNDFISNELLPPLRHTAAGQLLEDSFTFIRNHQQGNAFAPLQSNNFRDLSGMIDDVSSKKGWKEKTLAIMWMLTKILGWLLFNITKYVLWGTWIVIKWLGGLALQRMGATPKQNAPAGTDKQAGQDSNMADHEKRIRHAQYAAQDAQVRNMIADMEHKTIMNIWK